MSWLSEIAHDPSKTAMFTSFLSSSVALVASMVALLNGRRQSLASEKAAMAATKSADAANKSANAAVMTAKISGHREVARLRMQWMETLRSTLSKYHSLLMTTGNEGEESSEISIEDARELSRLGTELDLLLNQDDPPQKTLWDVADKIYELKTREERQALDPELMRKGRVVLKSEWEKVKAEMKGQDFQAN